MMDNDHTMMMMDKEEGLSSPSNMTTTSTSIMPFTENDEIIMIKEEEEKEKMVLKKAIAILTAIKANNNNNASTFQEAMAMHLKGFTVIPWEAFTEEEEEEQQQPPFPPLRLPSLNYYLFDHFPLSDTGYYLVHTPLSSAFGDMHSTLILHFFHPKKEEAIRKNMQRSPFPADMTFFLGDKELPVQMTQQVHGPGHQHVLTVRLTLSVEDSKDFVIFHYRRRRHGKDKKTMTQNRTEETTEEEEEEDDEEEENGVVWSLAFGSSRSYEIVQEEPYCCFGWPFWTS